MPKRVLLICIAVILLAPTVCAAKKYLILYNDASRTSIRLTKSYAGPVTAADQLVRSFKARVNIVSIEPNRRRNLVSTYVTDNYDLILSLGYEMAETTYTSAMNNKYQRYAIIGINRANLPDNAAGFTFAYAEGGFLAGYLAASLSKSGQVGFIGGQRIDPIRDFARGFSDGAQKANPDIKINSIFLNDFYDEISARNRADEIYRAGADVIFHAAGFSGRGVIEAARNAKALAIGVSGSDADLGIPTIANVVLDYNHTVYLACQMVEENRFQGGGTTLMNLHNAGMGFDVAQDVTSAIRQELDILKSDIAKGTVIVRNRNNKRVN